MVQVPRVPRGSLQGRPWPLAEKILSTIRERIKEKPLSIYCIERQRNRHGELVAMVKMPNGEWLQNLMIKEGLARVYSTPDFSYSSEGLYKLEDHARANGLGIWGLESYAVRNVDGLNNKTGRFEIVEGNVLKISNVNNTIYINFGEDWRKDFTLNVNWRALRRFKKVNMALDGLLGKKIQVRGWVSWNGGPTIDLTHPEQIRLLVDENMEDASSK